MANERSSETAKTLVTVAAAITFLSTLGCMALAMYFVSSLIFEWHVSFVSMFGTKKLLQKRNNTSDDDCMRFGIDIHLV